MYRRDLMLGGTIGLATSILSAPAALGQHVEALARPWEQSADIVSNDFWCGSDKIQRYHYRVQIFAYNRERWQLGDSKGPIRLSLPQFDPTAYEYDHGSTSLGYNLDGFRPVRGKRFGVRVPCKRRYRREIKLLVWAYRYDLATGRIVDFKGRGEPGRWLWLKHVGTRSGRAFCTV